MEVPLEGGNAAAGVIRVGETVRKPWLPTTPRTIEYLVALRAKGVDLPSPRGRDGLGRLILDHVPGRLAQERVPCPSRSWLGSVPSCVLIHDASDGLAVPADWDVLLPVDSPNLLCHNDLAPWNLIIDGDRLTFIDWDRAGPSTRLWDVAYAAIVFGHLFPEAAIDDAAARLAAFVNGYGAAPELRAALPDTMVERSAAMHDLLRHSHEAGREPWVGMNADGHGAHWSGTTEFIRLNRERSVEALAPARRRWVTLWLCTSTLATSEGVRTTSCGRSCADSGPCWTSRRGGGPTTGTTTSGPEEHVTRR